MFTARLLTLSRDLSIIDFIAQKMQAGGIFSTVEQDIIQALPSTALDAIHAKVGGSQL